MNKIEKELIMKLVKKEITKEDFINAIGINYSQIEDYIINLLSEALNENNAYDVEYAMLVGYLFGFSVKFVDVLCKLIVLKWHYQHENIANALQLIKDPQSIDCLYSAVLNITELEYLEYNNGEAFINKCIWAIGEMNTSYAKKKLQELSLSKNQLIENAAKYQLINNQFFNEYK